ncbi:MAG: response regulator [Bacteroidales bacterium]|nr:response regulator [Bacteroidales bacterium]MBN2697318.1 response regulator [Bacteroidales bacterium]
MVRQYQNLNYPTIDFSHTAFNKLMQNRIRRVLILSSNYDFFMLEEDGRIDEQIFNEYVSLNLRYPPVFIKATNAREAFSILENEDIDLVIEMLNLGDIDAFKLAKKIKESYENIPIVVLTHFNREVSLRIQNEDLSAIDYVFCWLGNADLLLAIIKLLEDRMNAKHDVEEVGVQVILLVEDSIRYTSTYLPELYRIVLQQSRDFMKEALNEHQKMLRMRGRPKILLAKTYDEALDLYEKYRFNMLGIISDVSFKRDNKRDKEEKLGLRLIERIRREDPFMPALLQSSDLSNAAIAGEMGVGFLHKYSKSLSIELRNFIMRNFAFGEFIFRDPLTLEEVDRAADLQALQHKILDLPDDVLLYHVGRNDFSKWLNARAIFPVAQLFKYVKAEDFNNLDEVRSYIYEAISSFRISKSRGIIAEFDKHSFDEYTNFSRIGQESIGGKARGLAFLNNVIQQQKLFNKYPDCIITVPRTVVLSTDIFDDFMEMNDLYKIGLSDKPDEEILEYFVNGRLPGWIHQDLYTFLSVVKAPLAIRSSSKLEDSHYQPFAGIYSTYMIPVLENNTARTMELLTNAIKSVYASVYFKSSKAYIEATSNVIDEEKMGIVLQEVCGTLINNLFFPTLSGVARSINFYPIAPEKTGEGIAKIAYGLGKYIMDGGVSLRFSPKYPKKILQLSTPRQMLRDTQRSFYALNTDEQGFKISTDDSFNLLRLKIDEAREDPALKYVMSVYDYQSDVVRDGLKYEGKKIVTFSSILQHNLFPLPAILQELLEIGQKEMNLPVEIEFAVNLNVPKGSPFIFNLLQIRPIVETEQGPEITIAELQPEDTILYSEAALGNGLFKNIRDIVYLPPGTFDPARSKEIAEQIEKINEEMKKQNRTYVLIGPGRWGSSDPWLGIPIKWGQISAARIIVESGLEDYRIDPSQGTHFFHNMVSFHVGYMTINPYISEGFYNHGYLDRLPACSEDHFVRHVRFDSELIIKIDGKSNRGVILKPGKGSV